MPWGDTIKHLIANRIRRPFILPGPRQMPPVGAESEIHHHPTFRLRQNRVACSLTTASRSGSTYGMIRASHKGINLSALVCRLRLHPRMLANRAPLDRKLPTGAEACFVRRQKERHGCHLLYCAHTIER